MDKVKQAPVQKGNGYDEQQIKVLKNLEAVRLRPGMYIGSTGPEGLLHLIYEVVDNSIDEAMAGRCTEIEVILHPDNRVTVKDNGGGIPVGIHKEEGISTVQVVLTILHAGGKFDNQAYKVSGGLHGVGVSVVNALAKELEVWVDRHGKRHYQRYARGIAQGDLKVIGSAEGTGTTITFMADDEIFPKVEYDVNSLTLRLRELAYLNPGLTIIFNNLHTEVRRVYKFDGGLASYVKALNEGRQPVHDEPIVFGREGDGWQLEIAMQFTTDYDENLYSFANNIRTKEGGTHLTGFKTALTRVFNEYGREKKILTQSDENLDGRDVREGLTAIVSAKVRNPQFEGQTKTKLGNSEMQEIASNVVREGLDLTFNKNPSVARAILEKAMLAARARQAAQKARQLVRRKDALFSSTLPGKLADCSEKEPGKCELFIVEGDSAGGCFSGDTLVALADGRTLSFEALVAEQAMGKEHFCYTIRHDGRIGLGPIINARMTKAKAQVIRVTLDTGEVIKCTPDHLFMLRDGSYKPAAALTSSDSLMPLYRKLSDSSEPGITIDGYEMGWDPHSQTWLFTHLLADWYNRWLGVYAEGDGDHCHHVDFNKRNNNPTNIQRLPAAEHLALHQAHVSRTLHRPEIVEKCRQLRQSDAFRAKMSDRMRQPQTRQLLCEQAKAQWADEAYKAYMIRKWRQFYNSNAIYRRESTERLNRAQRTYWSDEANRQAQAERVRQYFADNPSVRLAFSRNAQTQWQDKELLSRRREQTQEQWTPEFRAKRHAALQKTYYHKTIAALKRFEVTPGVIDLDAYRARRIATRDKSLLRFDTLCRRYFDGEEQKAKEAVANYNHRIVVVERLEERLDVYDIEVPGTHNFALACGVFVHNSAKQGRNRDFQAILPLRGKVLNVEKARLNKLLENKELSNVITALGTGIREEFDLERLRYGKVVIMTDADVDGAHIRTLLLTFFFRNFRSLIEAGHIYIAQPPLYMVRRGSKREYLFDDAALSEHRKGSKGNLEMRRFKGLGEMNAEELWETTMNPEARVLKQVSINDALEADELFTILMGSEVKPRRDFIRDNADKITNLDI